ncbi:MAG: flagellar biosynthesis protein [Ideonella sp.]|nr:flagellar biosynthesis protein [Ideonella sp.]
MSSSSSKRRTPPLRNVPPPDGARPAAAYARFIPREELSSFAAWNPEALTGGAAANAALRRTTDREPPAPGAACAAEELAAQLRAARHSGYQDGYRDGLAGLEEFRRSFASQVAQQLATLTTAYQHELDALQQHLAQAVAGAAEQVARQVVRSELATQPQAIAALAQEAIDTLLTSARHITLRVHPDDHALVADGVGEALAARGARLVADAALARGGCAVDADIGAVDATLQTRWARAVAALGRTSDWDDDDAAPPADFA